MATGTEYDFIICGAGIAGIVLASRLHEKDPALSILLIEAGPDPTKTALAETVAAVSGAPLLTGSELDWNYEIVPQKHLGGRQPTASSGRGVGGGSIINYGLWTRGDAKDYEVWAALVDDKRWSWEGMLPYFCKTEHHHDPDVDLKLHGRNGPIHTSSVTFSGRKYPLRDTVRRAWESLGVKEIPDVNCGDQIGMAEEVENRIDFKRIVAAAAYPLNGVTVMTESLVKRVLIRPDKVATGVELADGRKFAARREVVVSTGAFQTPKLLMLSGIGPKEELRRHGIELTLDSPEVGKNLWDHLAAWPTWRLRHPEDGLSVGSPKFIDPLFQNGNPLDWWTNQSVPREELKRALTIDNSGSVVDDSHPLLRSARSHLAILVYYVGDALDGTQITTLAVQQQPTSRGTVTLASADSNDRPIIDHNHLETEADRYRLRDGIRTIHKLMSTPAGKEMVIQADVPEGLKPITAESPDEDIDTLVRMTTQTFRHASGTASMGTVVDSELRVKDISGLRVVDTSVIPTPISSPIQALVYAMAKQAADIILPA